MYLRFSTAGSVDDGKSTLIGRLLHDTKSLFEDQWQAVQRASQSRGDEEVDLALLSDGLKAEREQRITIDVAYRYFSTPVRKFIIADTPGHEQYTRNMVTGASTSELAILLVDARKGISAQTKRHAFISTLLGIPHLVVAVNKMDLVDYQREVFQQIQQDFQAFASRLQVHDIVYIPISALRGDNVVSPSHHMPWYGGGTLLRHLETVNLGATRNVIDFRFPIQYVLRPNQDFRGYAGQVASGRIRPGHRVLVLPSGVETRVKKVMTADGERGEAFAGESVVLCLEEEVEAGRGTLLVRPDNLPHKASELDLTLCWMDHQPLQLDKNYWIVHNTRWLLGHVRDINYRVNVNTMNREPSDTLQLNDIGRIQLVSSEPLFFDPYKVNRATGNLILVDPDSHNTVAAGIIRGRARTLEDVAPDWGGLRASPQTPPRTQDWGGLRASPQTPPRKVYPQSGSVSLQQREERNLHPAFVIWFTGLSGSGKTTLAKALEERLFHQGKQTMFIDGDNLRHGLCADLGFSPQDRQQNIQRAAWTAQLAFNHGLIVVCSFISPFRQDRDFARSLIPQGRFLEVYASCDIEICKRRDPKGLYQKALRGEIPEFTGISSPYEVPHAPELTLETEILSVEQCLDKLLARLEPL